MSVLTRLLESYEKNHQNPINEAIHIIAIPLIMFSILGVTAAFDIFLEYILVGIVLFYYSKTFENCSVINVSVVTDLFRISCFIETLHH